MRDPLYLRVRRAREHVAGRDSERQRAYASETSAIGWGEPLGTLAATRRYVARVCRSAWMRKEFPHVARHGIRVDYNPRLRTHSAQAMAWCYAIETNKHGMTKTVMLHEIARVRRCGHGP